jgi:spore coat polysaccharide biosynthesis protein SpsF
MTCPPLAIIQARMGSKRLPGKVLLPIAGRTLIHRVWATTVEAFGYDHTVVAYPDTPENEPLRTELARICAIRFAWNGPENDVLGRFHACAHTYRWHPDSVIVRVTADDPFKDVLSMRRVAAGERLPVELGGEAFTLAMLDAAIDATDAERYGCFPGDMYSRKREHITYIMFPTPPPPPPPGVWSIDTSEDYAAVCSAMDAT